MEILVQEYIFVPDYSDQAQYLPAIPVSISAKGVVPAVIHVLQNKLKMKEKATKLKMHH